MVSFVIVDGGGRSNRSRRTFDEELPWLAKEVQRVENIREYVGEL